MTILSVTEKFYNLFSKTTKVPTFEIGEYINTKEYVNNESD